MKLLSFFVPVTSAVVALSCAPRAEGALIYGVTDEGGFGGELVSFDSATPGTVTTVGLLSGVTNLRGIDFRPSNNRLYGVGYANATGMFQLYTINTATAAATAVGPAYVLPGFVNGTRVSIDVNPVVDTLRVIVSTAATTANYRIDLDTGELVAQDTNFSPAALYADIAYTNNFAGAAITSLFTYNFNNDTIGRVDSPNAGIVTTVGPSGWVAFTGAVGLDVDGAGTAFLMMDDQPSLTDEAEFYTVNLATGAATLVGVVTDTVLLDIAAATVPEPGTGGLAVMGAGALLMRRRRKGVISNQ